MDNLDFLELAEMRKQLYLRAWTAVIQSDHTPDKAFNNIPAPSSCCECENWKFSGFFYKAVNIFVCLLVIFSYSVEQDRKWPFKNLQFLVPTYWLQFLVPNKEVFRKREICCWEL